MSIEAEGEGDERAVEGDAELVRGLLDELGESGSWLPAMLMPPARPRTVPRKPMAGMAQAR